MRIVGMVILVFAALPLIHCGGSSSSGGGTGGSADAGPEGCPAERPHEGYTCNTSDLSCHYEGGAPCTRDWLCTTLSFDSSVVAWRQALDTLQSAPCDEVGTTCSMVTTYNGDCCPTYHETICTPSKRWDLVKFETDKPSECPAALPIAGEPCDSGHKYYNCIYPVSAACSSTTATAYCTGSVWKVVSTPCPP
jgi:hypothetical protein